MFDSSNVFEMLNLLYENKGKKTNREFYEEIRELQQDISFWLSEHFPKICEAECLAEQWDVDYDDTDDLYSFVS